MKPASKLPRISIGASIVLLLFSLLFIILFPSLPFFNNLNPQFLQTGLIILALFIFLLQFRSSQKRLQLLSEIAASIGQGNLDVRSDDDHDDAIGKMAAAVNWMADKIGQSINELEKIQSNLEASREELETKNKKLSLSFSRQEKFGSFLTNISSIEINHISEASLVYLMDLANSQIGIFYTYDEQRDELSCLCKRSLDQRFLKSFTPDGALAGLPGEVLRRRSWISLEDIDAESLPDINLGFTHATIRCLYGIPILFQKKILGVVILAGMRSIDETTRRDLVNNAEVLSNALTNAITYRSVQKQSIQLEHANRELLTATKQKSEFVANMSHELRTPLNSIIGFSGILLKNRKGNLHEADLSRVEKIHRNGRHLLELINDILDLSKIEAGRMDLFIEKYDIVTIVSDVVEMIQPQADAKNIQLKTEFSDDPIMKELDEQKMRQVLINLVGNAVKFTQKGSVTVKGEIVDKASNAVRIQVIDSGIGIPDDKIDKIFEAFSQVDTSESRQFGGTGLGLTISRNIIGMLGGTLTVESKHGEGSVFSVFFAGDRIKSDKQFELDLQTAPEPGDGTEADADEVNNQTDGTWEDRHSPETKTKPEVEPISNPAAQKDQDESGPISASRLDSKPMETIRRLLPISPGKRILIVDDDPDAREFIANCVKELGADCEECGNSTEVLERARIYNPHLITLDIMMPESNGWEVLSKLKGDKILSEIPVIIISMVADRRKAVSLGAVDALAKPILQNDFFNRVRRALNSERLVNRKILIIDDSEEYQDLLKSWLDDSKNEIRSAFNGREGLEILKKYRPDLICLDLLMPVMDGVSFLREFRSEEEYADIPVIVITGKHLSNLERNSIQGRAESILEKGKDLIFDS